MDSINCSHETLAELAESGAIRLIKPAGGGRPAAGKAGRRPPTARELAGGESSNTPPANRHQSRFLGEKGGLDWLAVSVVGEKAANWRRMIEAIAHAQEEARENGFGMIEMHHMGEYAEVMPYSDGTGKGYMDYVLMYRGIRICVSGKDKEPDEPIARVQIGGRKFLEYDMHGACELADFALWCLGIDCDPTEWKVSRVDVCVDLCGVSMEDVGKEFGAGGEGIVTRATTTQVFAKHRKVQTCYAGSGNVQLRIYNKIAELARDPEKAQLMIAQRWGGSIPENATRFEYQVRRESLRDRGIETMGDLVQKLAGLCNWLTEDWCRLVGQGVDRRNSQRDRGDCIWRKVVAAFREWAGVAASLRRVVQAAPDVSTLTTQALGCLTSIAAKLGATTVNEFRDLVVTLAKQRYDESELVDELRRKAHSFTARGYAVRSAGIHAQLP